MPSHRFDALTRTLTTAGIPPDEIEGLERAVAADRANGRCHFENYGGAPLTVATPDLLSRPTIMLSGFAPGFRIARHFGGDR
jgi:hypothetical protein